MALVALAVAAGAQSVREHTRGKPDRSTAVTEAQATELTLTMTEVAVRPIQVWVRTAAVADPARRILSAAVLPSDGGHLKIGQRVRAFPPDSRSSMYQARVSGIVAGRDRVLVTATLAGPGSDEGDRYVLEIVTDRGEFLSVPNEAIIETGAGRLVYVEESPGRYRPREIRAGVQGELFTQILGGLKAGERVVTLGSFFIDAEHKLKG